MKKILLLFMLVSGLANAQLVLPFPVSAFSTCDDDNGDGRTVFNLNFKEGEILGTLDPSVYMVQYFESVADATNAVNPIVIPNAYTNLLNPQSIGIRVTNRINPADFGVTFMDIRVVPKPFANSNIDLQMCATNNLGFEQFQLSVVNLAVGGADPTAAVSYFETRTDAENNVNSLSLEYTNIVPWQQTIFARVTATSGCYAIGTVNLRVQPSPFVMNLPEIVHYENPSDGFYSHFDLTVQIPRILNFLPSFQYQVKFYKSFGDAWSGVNPIQNPENYANTTNPETIVVSVLDTMYGCQSVSFFNISVSNQLGVSEVVANKIGIYPNPANDRVTIQSATVIESIGVFDIQGRLTLEVMTNEKEHLLDVSGFVSGIYLLKINSDQGIETRRLVKD